MYSDCAFLYGKIDDPKGMSCAHYHDDYEIYFLVNGSRKYFLSTKICTVQPNQVVLIKPNEPHQVTVNLNIPYERYVIYISPKLLSTICKENPSLKKNYETELFCLPEDIFNQAINLVLRINDEINRKDIHSPDAIKNIISELLILISRNDDTSNHIVNKSDIRLQSSINYILEHFDEQITLDDCAKIACMPPTRFSTFFHKSTALTFKEFLNKIRIDKACELLKTSTDGIAEIAQKVGFTTESYFGSVFKTIKKVSPSNYRKQQIEND